MSELSEMALRTPAKSITKRKSPAERTLQEVMVHMYHMFKEENEKAGIKHFETEIMARIALLTNHSFCTITKVVRNSKQGKRLTTPGKNRRRNRAVTGIDNFAKEAVARFIYDKLKKGEVVTAKNILDHMISNEETFLFKGSLTSVRRILKEMQFVWSKGDKYAYVRESEDVRFKRTCFLREYVKNKESEKPKPVVFLDETWIFMNGQVTHSWNKPQKVGSDVSGVIRRPISEGGRLVIVHAGTVTGFVPGADLIFASDLKRNQDYHGAMNSDTFQSWVKTQLIVGLRKLGSCVVIMDNASYHCKLVEKQPTTKWRKDELLSWLRQSGITPSPDATKNELQKLCHMNRSHLKRYVVDEMLRNEGHSVLRLPPYHSFFNAIELAWSVAKGYYNKTVASRAGHGLDRARTVWKEALDQVTEGIWQNEVKHTEEIIMKYYNDEKMVGALLNVKHRYTSSNGSREH